jgi:RND family efflux transporter MFP subunit
VGIVEAGVLKIYLDRYENNTPIEKASIEIEATGEGGSGGPLKTTLTQSQDGAFTWSHETFAKPGRWALSFTIEAAGETDLLAGTLDIPDPHSADEQASSGWLSRLNSASLVQGALAFGVLMMALIAFRRLRRRRQGLATLALPAGGLVLAAALSMASQTSWAGPGHSHDEPTAAATGNAPKRMSDGSVFLPKPSQRELEVRTLLVKSATVAQAFEFNGRVVMDPSAGGRIQSAQGGRVEAAAAGLPRLGQQVKKGQVLAIIRPTVAPIEAANQAATISDNRIALDLAKRRLARLEQLEGTVPQRDIDAARSEVQTLEQRAGLTRASLAAVETLVAPISGVIAYASIVAGQIVASNDVLFEIIDPSRLLIEALAYDSQQVSMLQGSASMQVGARQVELRLLGVGRQLREQAIPVQFQITATGDPLPLAVGQPVSIKARSAKTLNAITVPAAALMKNPSNQDIVWVHTEPERFEPRVVRFEPLDGASVAVVQGLKEGDRVVIRSASLVNQVR